MRGGREGLAPLPAGRIVASARHSPLSRASFLISFTQPPLLRSSPIPSHSDRSPPFASPPRPFAAGLHPAFWRFCGLCTLTPPPLFRFVHYRIASHKKWLSSTFVNSAPSLAIVLERSPPKAFGKPHGPSAAQRNVLDRRGCIDEKQYKSSAFGRCMIIQMRGKSCTKMERKEELKGSAADCASRCVLAARLRFFFIRVSGESVLTPALTRCVHPLPAIPSP